MLAKYVILVEISYGQFCFLFFGFFKELKYHEESFNYSVPLVSQPKGYGKNKLE